MLAIGCPARGGIANDDKIQPDQRAFRYAEAASGPDAGPAFLGSLVADPEAEVRKLLAALGLDFEEACLRFHENPRAVRTASSEQVRRPVNRDGVGQWRRYAERIDPLREALGGALEGYPHPT